MPRKMSFALTTEQIAVRVKFVTRRFGWWFLKPGDLVEAVKKCMGLKAGEKVQPIMGPDGNRTLIEIIHTRPEPLNTITPADVTLEGFPWLDTTQFIDMLVQKHKCEPAQICNRIEFGYCIDSGSLLTHRGLQVRGNHETLA